MVKKKKILLVYMKLLCMMQLKQRSMCCKVGIFSNICTVNFTEFVKGMLVSA